MPFDYSENTVFIGTIQGKLTRDYTWFMRTDMIKMPMMLVKFDFIESDSSIEKFCYIAQSMNIIM